MSLVGRVAIPVDYDFGHDGCLHIVGPGLQDDEYAERVQNFDWRNFYKMYDGAKFIDTLAQDIKNQYELLLSIAEQALLTRLEYVRYKFLISVVFCFTYNRQSVEGIQNDRQRVMAKKKPLKILLRPMRVEKDIVGIQPARSYARSVLGSYTGRHTDRDLLSYWDAAEVPHYPGYSFEEILAVFAEVAGGRNNLLADMELLASEIENAAISMPPLPEDFRLRTLARFRWGDPDETTLEEALPGAPEIALQKGIAPLPAHFHNLPGINPSFVGRHQELEIMNNTLRSVNEIRTVRAIVGLGGVGKSQLALAFAYRHLADYRLVWWL